MNDLSSFIELCFKKGNKQNEENQRFEFKANIKNNKDLVNAQFHS